jgi:SNF2 family DNA or RNA helicase
VYTDDKRVLGLNPSAKLSELDTILTETDRKVIIFVPYTHALRSVAAHVAKTATVGVVDGSVSKGKRDQIFYQFQHSDDPRVIVAHPRTMSHGLTLTESNTIVWFCPPDGLDTYIQANARIVRTSQKHKTNIIHLQSMPVERKAYKRLQNNERLQGMLLDMYEGVDDRA